MKISTKSNGGDFLPHPVTQEPVRAVCVDVTPVEKIVGQYGPKLVFKLVFESEMEKEGGERFCVWSRRFNVTMNEKSTLRAFLKQMFGEDVGVTKADKGGDVDPEEICLNFPVKMMIGHTVREGETYADITTIFPDRGSAPLAPSGRFVRKKDRPARDDASSGTQQRISGQPATQGGGDWKTTVIPAGKHMGKQLQDLSADELPVFIKGYQDWAKGRQLAPADRVFCDAVFRAKEYLDEISDGISF